METFKNIRANDRISYRTAQGQIKTGRAQALLIFENHAVLKTGNGRPIVVNESNFIANQSAQIREYALHVMRESRAPIPGMSVNR